MVRVAVDPEPFLVHHRGSCTLIHTSGGFGITTQLTAMFLGGGKKPENPEEAYTDMGSNPNSGS